MSASGLTGVSSSLTALGQYPHSMGLESLGAESLWTTFNCSEREVDLLSPPYLGMGQSVSLRKKYRFKFCSQKTN